MGPRSFVLLTVIGVTLAGCQRQADEHAKDSTAGGPEASATASPESESARADRTQELERRVAELEERLASPAPQESPVLRVEETRTPAPRRPATARPNPPRAATPARPAPTAEPRETADVEPSRSARDEPPAPRPRPVTIPEDAELTLVLETGLSSATSEEGDRVVARVERAASEDGRVALPGGAVLQGRVTEVAQSGKVKGRARLVVSFDRIVVRGESYPIDTTDIEVEADSEGKRDAVIIGGSTAAGAILGAIVKGGAKKGAVVGAAGGAAAVLLTKGKEIELPSGSRWIVKVRRPAQLGRTSRLSASPRRGTSDLGRVEAYIRYRADRSSAWACLPHALVPCLAAGARQDERVSGRRGSEPDSSDRWRAELLGRFGLALFGAAPLVAYTSATANLSGVQLVALWQLVACGAVVALARRADFRLRGILLVGSLLVAGAMLASRTGSTPGTLLSLALGSVLATVLFGVREGFLALGASAACFLTFGLAGRLEMTARWAEELPRPETWIRMTTTFTFVTGLLVLLVSSAVRRVEQSLTQTKASLAEAVRERHARAAAEHALRENEERLRLALEAAEMGIWERRLDTGTITWTREMEALVGFEPAASPARSRRSSRRSIRRTGPSSRKRSTGPSHPPRASCTSSTACAAPSRCAGSRAAGASTGTLRAGRS